MFAGPPKSLNRSRKLSIIWSVVCFLRGSYLGTSSTVSSAMFDRRLLDCITVVGVCNPIFVIAAIISSFSGELITCCSISFITSEVSLIPKEVGISTLSVNCGKSSPGKKALSSRRKAVTETITAKRTTLKTIKYRHGKVFLRISM